MTTNNTVLDVFKTACNKFLLNDPIGEANRDIHEIKQCFNYKLVPPECNLKRHYCPRIFLNSFNKYFEIETTCIVSYDNRNKSFNYYFDKTNECIKVMKEPIILGKKNKKRNREFFLKEFCNSLKKNVEYFPFQSREYFSYPKHWYPMVEIDKEYAKKKGRKRIYSDEEKEYLKDSENYLAIRIQSLDNLINEDDRFFLLLIGTDIFAPDNYNTQYYDNKENTLFKLVNAWGNMISHWRQYLTENCHRIPQTHDKTEIERRRTQIFNILCSIPEFLAPDELVNAIQEATPPCRIEENDKFNAEMCIKPLLSLFTKCSRCHPANWPFFSHFIDDTYKIQNKLLILLSKIGYWCKVGIFDIGDIRRNSKADPYLLKASNQLKSDLLKIGKKAHYSIRCDNLIHRSSLAFFLAMVLLPYDNDFKNCLTFTDMKSNCFSDEEIAKALQKFSNLILYIFADLNPDEQILRSIMWLVSEYTHKTLSLPKRFDIGAHLLLAARGEPALHSMKNYYRDHFFHALEVCFLGHFLLEMKLNDKNEYLWEIIDKQINGGKKMSKNKNKRKKSILKLWYLSALLHDLGYCIDIQKSVLGLLDFLQNSVYLKEFTIDLKEAIKKLSEKIGDLGFVGYDPADDPGKDHGIIGALHLYGLLENIVKDDKSVLIDEYKPVVRAIALHNSRRHTVSFKNDPLAFLLILCDTIQEWNRPRLDFATAPTELLSRLMRHGAREEDFTGPLDNVSIDAKDTILDTGIKEFSLKENNALHFRLKYTSDIQFNSGVFNLWLDASCNFQRLSFDGLDKDFNIDVEYVTPVYRDEKGAPYQQLYRLRDAARETHMGFLEHWFPDQIDLKRKGTYTNGAISYSTEKINDNSDEEEYEHLTLHLRELCNPQKPRITRDIDAFREYLSRWKQYNNDRQFKGDYAVPKFPV
ncbi:MAG: hypothetical protein JXJ04_26165 [Spirochaetales bacterium]|nr:hypothetical protein [Spirochaetales bacterium]